MHDIGLWPKFSPSVLLSSPLLAPSSYPTSATSILAMASQAELLRHKGNHCFLSSSPSLAPCLRLSKLRSASSFYLRALDASHSHEDKAASAKNLGFVHWELAKLGSSPDAASLGTDMYPHFYLSRSASYFCEAIHHGRIACKSAEWMANIDENLAEIATIVVEDAKKAAEAESNRGKFTLSVAFETLVDLCKKLSKAGNAAKRATVIAYTGQAECLLEVTFKLFRTQSSPFRPSECLQEFQKCQALLEVAEGHSDSLACDKVQNLRRRIESGQSFCECVQGMRAGAQFAKQASQSTDPSKRIDYALGAIDMYKEAEVKARGLDEEARAIAMISIGKVYEEILKLPLQAMAYYGRSLEMVSEGDFKDKDLYASTECVLQRLERLAARDGDSEADRRKRSLKEQMKEDLSEIGRQFTKLDAIAFLEYIYLTHPPLKSRRDVGSEAKSLRSGAASARVSIRRAILLYHPDTNACTDDRWNIVAEEITKCLLLKYSHYKEAAPANCL